MKRNRLASVFCGFAGLLAVHAPMAAPSAGIVSTPAHTGVAGGSASHSPSFSGHGRYVLYLSHANNLVTNDSNGPYLDVFLHDLMTSNTVLVSASHSGTGGGDGDSAYACISSNGQFVAFSSGAGNLVAGDTNNAGDVFIRDVTSGLFTLVSKGLDGGGALGPSTAAPRSGNPSFSVAGDRVLFESVATNLVALNDTNSGNDLFLWNRETGTSRLISVNADGTGTGNRSSELGSMSLDATRVAFVSFATDLVPGATNSGGDIYVRDLQADTTLWASTNVATFFPAYQCFAPVMNENGGLVVFKAAPPGSSVGGVFDVVIATGESIQIGTNSPTATPPSQGGFGRLIAFEQGTNIFVWDRWGRTNALVDARFDGTGPGNGPSKAPVLSADGRSVAFLSAATDLVADGAVDTNEIYQVFVRDLQTGVTRLVSGTTNGTPALASHPFAQLAISDDGGRVVFDSRSGDLVSGDLNRESDVFVRDFSADETRLISRRAESLPSLTGARHVRIAPDCLSADGRHLLFASLRKDLPPDDGICCENLFIRDLTTGTEEQITTFDDVRPKEQVISANGRGVAYVAQPLMNSPMESVVLYNRDTGTRLFAHGTMSGGGFLTGPFKNLTVSPDGRKVAYLASRGPGSVYDLYLFDSQTGSNRMLNVRWDFPTSPFGWGQLTSPPRFSPDGRWLAFGNESVELTANRQLGLLILDLTDPRALQVIPATNNFIFPQAPAFSADSRFVGAGRGVFDLESKTYTQVSTNLAPSALGRHSLSADGRFEAREERTEALDFIWNILVTDLRTGSTKLASINTNFSGGGGTSLMPAITPDGRYVIYTSRATNLIALDRSPLSDIYARDLVRGVTILLSSSRDGSSSGSGGSTMPVLSADGRTVLFQSFADDLAPGDFNFSRDIFIAQIGGPDSDRDQMDDDWEMAYFSTLSRDGAGDYDGDGASDLSEFNAGTDPANLGSFFRVITITSLGGGQRSIIWSAVPGRTYRVQFKNSVDDEEWTELPSLVTASGTTASMADTGDGTNARRFYRVLLQ